MSRHPAVELQRRLLVPNQNLPSVPLAIACAVQQLSETLLDILQEDNNEVTEGLRELVRAKDSFIRAHLINEGVI